MGEGWLSGAEREGLTSRQEKRRRVLKKNGLKVVQKREDRTVLGESFWFSFQRSKKLGYLLFLPWSFCSCFVEETIVGLYLCNEVGLVGKLEG